MHWDWDDSRGLRALMKFWLRMTKTWPPDHFLQQGTQFWGFPWSNPIPHCNAQCTIHCHTKSPNISKEPFQFWKKTLIIMHHVGLLFLNQWYPIYMRNINIFSRKKWRQAKLRPRRQFIIESRYNCRKVNLIILQNILPGVLMFQRIISQCHNFNGIQI